MGKTKYPALLTNLADRETEDINRLAKCHKNHVAQQLSNDNSGRVISRFVIEGGKAVPIYRNQI